MTKGRIALLGVLVCFLIIWAREYPVLADGVTYNGEAAIVFADGHCRADENARMTPNRCVNGWFCAAFVSKCLQAGGLDFYNSSSTELHAELVASGLFTEYVVPNDSDHIHIDDVPGELAIGDVFFYYCDHETDGKPYTHTQIFAGWTDDGRAIFYSHNYRVIGRADNYYSCYICGMTLKEVHILHFKNPPKDQRGPYPANHWLKVKGKWYYFGYDGKPLTGLQTLEGGKYFFNASGAMQTGWKKISGKWYYFGKSGTMLTDWKRLDGKWYYFGTNGAMQTGWKRIDEEWYYFPASGAMTTGWKNIGGKWYCFTARGAMRTGWYRFEGARYYFDDSGRMATRWKKINDEWYYFATSGVLQTGWQMISGRRYYFRNSGMMQTGLTTIDGVVYYFDLEEGMQTGEVEIDGMCFTFDEEGVLIGVEPIPEEVVIEEE